MNKGIKFTKSTDSNSVYVSFVTYSSREDYINGTKRITVDLHVDKSTTLSDLLEYIDSKYLYHDRPKLGGY